MKDSKKRGRGRPKMAENQKKVNVGLKLRPEVKKHLESLKGDSTVNDLITQAVLEKYYK